MIWRRRLYTIANFVFMMHFLRGGELSSIELLKKEIQKRITLVRKGEKTPSYLHEESMVDGEIERLPLSVAVKHNLHNEMKELLNTGADPLWEGAHGGPLGEVQDRTTLETLLEFAHSSEKFVTAFADFFHALPKFKKEEQFDTFQWLLDHDIDPNELMPRYGLPKKITKSAYFLPLIRLTILATVEKLEVQPAIVTLLEHGADPYKKGVFEFSAYDFAEAENARELAKLLETKYAEYCNNVNNFTRVFYTSDSLFAEQMPQEKKVEMEDCYKYSISHENENVS